MIAVPQTKMGPIRHKTSQGLTIIAERMPVDAVNFSLWVHSGSASEPDQENGMAHFLEHMVFKGTSRLAPGDFERLVEQRGGIMNAATGQDYTCFYSTVAPQNFADVAPAQIDLVLNAQIPELEFEREQQVVLEEIRRAQDNPRQRIFAQTMAIAYQKLPYRRQILGPVSIVETLTPGQMQRHHARQYQPNNMTAVVVGNLSEEKLIQSVINGFEAHAGTQQNTPVYRQTWPSEPPITESQTQTLYDSRITQARLFVLWHVPGIQQLSETYAFDILARVLAHGRNAFLVQDLREKKGLVSSISASNYTQSLQGLFWIAANLPTENIKVVRTSIEEHIQRLQSELVDPQLLARVQRQVTNQFIFENESPSSRAGLYGFHEAIASDLEAGLYYPNHIKAVSQAQIQSAAQQYLSLNACRWVTFLPGEGEEKL